MEKRRIELPTDFINNLTTETGQEQADGLMRAIGTPSPTAIRFNPFKVTSRPEGKQVPWNRYGFLLDERPSFTLDPLMHAGVYYVQEPSSMFIEYIYRTAMEGERRNPRILDLCAAPGGKSTLLSTLVGLEGIVVANEVIRQRAVTLQQNAVRWGLGNIVVTNNDPQHFGSFRHYFDMLVVDAPCSGEGMFRKNPEAISEWSLNNVSLCAQRQRRILAEVWDSLKPGGLLIYSTCTFNRSENEDNVEWLAREYNCEQVEIPVPDDWGIEKGEVEGGINTFRFYPHRLQGEGFFCSVLRKGEGKSRTAMPRPRKTLYTQLSKNDMRSCSGFMEQPEFMTHASIGENIYSFYRSAFADMRTIAEACNALYAGVETGQLFHGKLKPAHALSLFHDLNREAVTETGLQLEQALDYLRKYEPAPQSMAEGLNLITYNEMPLGWAKRIGNRANNMLPKEYRIVNL